MRILVALLVVISGVVSFAKDNQVQKFVDEYYKSKGLNFHGECQRTGDCVSAVCNGLGSSGCDDRWEVDEVLQWCRGNYDGDCVATSCRFLGSSGCDDRWEVQEIARACVGNMGGGCVQAVCSRLGDSGCDDRWEILDVIKKCAGN
jgi:hypothetical protein